MKKIILLSLFVASSIESFGQVFARIRVNGVNYSDNSTIDLDCGTLNLTISAAGVDQAGNFYWTKCQSGWSYPNGWQLITDNGCEKEFQTNSLGEGSLAVTYVIYCGQSCIATPTVTVHFKRKIPPTPSISPNALLICGGGNVNIDASFVPFAYGFTWGAEGGASVTSTGFSSANVTATGIGKAKVRADADPSTGCPNSGWGEAYVHFGAPTVNGITVNTSMCSGYGQTVTANVLGNPTYTNWYVSSGNASNTYLTDYGSGSAYFNSYVPDCYGLTINMSNACGSSSDGTTICVDDCFARYSAYPNPSKDVMNIEFGEIKNKESLPEYLDLFEEKSGKKILSIDVQDAINKKTLKSDGVLSIYVGDLPRGIYYLHITPTTVSTKKKQIIQVRLE